MLFSVIMAKLHCKECENQTEHLICFMEYRLADHAIKIIYYCQDCFDLSAELGTTYYQYEKWINARQYIELHRQSDEDLDI